MKSLLFLSCCLAPSIQAGLLYYLPFATGYDPAAIVEDGLKGQGVVGHGNFGETNANASADLLPTSLVYVDAQGNTLATAGGAALIDSNEETADVSNIAPLALTGANAPAGNTLWISFIGQQTAGTTARFFNLGLRAPDNTFIVTPPNIWDSGNTEDEIIVFGMGSMSSSQVWHMYDRGTNSLGRILAPSEIPSTKRAFILARIELNAEGSNERYTMWVDPPLGVVPDEGVGLQFVSVNSDFNAWSNLFKIRLAAGYQNATGPSSAWQVDEIRMGDTWQDVTPYLPLQIVACTRTSTNTLEVTWSAAPNCTDTVEWSTDLAEWHPFATSTRINPPSSVLATWETPVQTEPRVYFRVSRLR